MNITTVRIPKSILLVLSIICAVISLPLILTSPAEAQIRFPGKKQKPKPGATPKPTPTPPPQVVRFRIQQGKVNTESITLKHFCQTENSFSIKIDQSFIQVVGPSEGIPFRPGENITTFRIDATRLEPMVYRSGVNVSCLNCTGNCHQLDRAFIIEVNVTKASAQIPKSAPQPTPSTRPTTTPTPLPTPSPGGSPTTAGNDEEVRALAENGPQLPEKFNLSNFSYKFFVRRNMLAFFDYAVPERARVTLTISAGSTQFIHQFKETKPGRHREYFRILPSLGDDRLLVGIYTFKAMSDDTPNAVPVPLTIWAFAVGEAVGSSGIQQVTLTPREIQVGRSKPAPKASYSFRSLRSFSRAAAVIRLQEGGNSEEVNTRRYDRNIGEGEVIYGEWDCKRGGSPSIGRHKLFVKAWYTPQRNGAHVIATSLQVLVRR